MKKIIISEIEKFIAETENNRILYHGSGKYFNKFDMNYVNTGQHSQDFGYGLYFTTNKETAEFYANEMSATKTPIEKYNEIVKNNEKNEILYDYITNNYVISAKRILNNLISTKTGDVDEWKSLLHSLNNVQRYGFVYTVKITTPNFINKVDYEIIQYKLKISDKDMSNFLLKKGYNGIIYRINSFGLNKKINPENEYNVVIIDDNIINIINVEKIEFEGVLNINNLIN